MSLKCGLLIFFLYFAEHTLFAQKTFNPDSLKKDFHKSRREAIREKMPPNSVAIFFSAPVRNKSNDVNYEYHQDPSFYYLTGYNEPNSLLLIFKEEQNIRDFVSIEFLFVQNRDEFMETWLGKRLGKEGAKKKLGFSVVLLNTDFKDFPINFNSLDQILILPFPEGLANNDFEEVDIFDLVEQFKTKLASFEKKVDYKSLPHIISSLREVKTAEEIALMKKAIDITCLAHIELAKALKAGMTEYQSQAITEYVFQAKGAECSAFPSIVAGGENSCILHYTTNRKTLEGKDLLVVDIGAQYHAYAADVTRTFPVDGKFSPEEKAIYELVLKAQDQAIKECQVNNSFEQPGNVATEIIAQGLIELGIIKQKKDVVRYFMHGTSHYLGLDVHDIGLFESFKPGNVITVEPGIYIKAGSDCDPKWWNIGVRIEDDILITDKGPENLSTLAPKSIEEIEALMQEESLFNQILK